MIHLYLLPVRVNLHLNLQVEQLMILPVAVLTGLLKKFENDEESEVRRVKEK